MLPNNCQQNCLRVANKEITLFFASPIAYLFLAAYIGITLFTFFWGEAFFSRNIADVRPLFEWMPILLIFLCSTLTMRLWSEERRSGTIEYVHTQAIPLWHFVIGKFIGCLALLVIALVMTLPLPITVALIADLDWGPVFSGYIATLLLGAAYLSIGLAVSSRSDNQIVSLISACAICGIFYFVGTATFTHFFNTEMAEFLRQLSTGARFEDITRGVIDLRDLYYYLSLIFVFLALNTFYLEKERWVTSKSQAKHRYWQGLTALLVLNALSANLWLGQLPQLRWDITEGEQYSISEATEQYLAQLQEPLLIRGYFSQKTHPLLAPLVPQVKDLIKEYDVAGQGKVRVEFIDPQQAPDLEKEANSKYGIRPVPFQVADRYQASIVSSYFNVLIQYGDEHQVLGFRELIEINARAESDIDVQLRNPEHDITSAIKTVLKSYQSSGDLFDTVKETLTFNAYISNDNLLPAQLTEFKATIEKVLAAMAKTSKQRLIVNFQEPEAENGKVAKEITEQYGFQPMATSLFSDKSFYFYLTLMGEEQIVQIPLDDYSESAFERNLDAAIKRFATGFTKNVALVTPTPAQNPYSPYGNQSSEYSLLQQSLSGEMTVHREDLSDGQVAGDADILVLAAPDELDEKQLFAIDQFLMKGGTVIAATSPYKADISRGLSMAKHDSSIHNWLKHHGLEIEEALVMDSQNAALPVPITRNVGGFQIQERKMLDYPYFVDVRGQGLNQENLITAKLPQATMAWASPIKLTQDQHGRTVTPLLTSSANAWLSDSLDIMPKLNQNGLASYASESEQSARVLGVLSQGKFTSYFADKPSPLMAQVADDSEQEPADQSTNDNESNEDEKADDAEEQWHLSSVIKHSTDSARIILFSSNDFLRDQIIQLSGGVNQTEYLNTLQLVLNAVEWSLEDRALLSIRSRGHFNRTLPPMEHDSQLFWEYLNYSLAIVILGLIVLIHRRVTLAKQRHYLTWLTQ